MHTSVGKGDFVHDVLLPIRDLRGALSRNQKPELCDSNVFLLVGTTLDITYT